MQTMTVQDDWGWRESDPVPLSAYIHVPFCAHRCGYCNFSLLANRGDLFSRYLAALEKELAILDEPRPVSTIFASRTHRTNARCSVSMVAPSW
jgi:coproporphyrinogen III oxidase-like Fe-S oxidoreductase